MAKRKPSAQKKNTNPRRVTPRNVSRIKVPVPRRVDTSQFQNMLTYNQALENLPNQTRSGRRPNPADPRTTLGQSLGQTQLGSCAALKMLHPCGEYDLNKIKVPDGAVSTSVALERRDEYEIQPPTTIANAPSWTCLVLHLPFVLHRDIVMKWPSTVTSTDDEIYAAILSILSTNYTDLAIYPTFNTLASVVSGGSSAPFYNTAQYSLLTSATLTPALLNFNNHTNLYKDIRRSCLGYTTDLDASELYNQGRVISGQWTPAITLGTVDTTTMAANPTSGGDPIMVVGDEFDTYDFTAPAVSTNTIVSSDMFRRQAEAKYGSYMPIRLCTPKVDFSSSSELRMIRAIAPGSSAITNATLTQDNANDIWLRGWCVGTELWVNLDPHAQLRMKVVEDLELDPSPSSTFSPFMSVGYPQDDLALSIVREFARLSPHAYDADFNRMNKLTTTLVNGLGTVLSNLGIPIVSALAKPVTRLITNKFGYQQPTYSNTMQPLD